MESRNVVWVISLSLVTKMDCLSISSEHYGQVITISMGQYVRLSCLLLHSITIYLLKRPFDNSGPASYPNPTSIKRF